MPGEVVVEAGVVESGVLFEEDGAVFVEIAGPCIAAPVNAFTYGAESSSQGPYFAVVVPTEYEGSAP